VETHTRQPSLGRLADGGWAREEQHDFALRGGEAVLSPEGSSSSSPPSPAAVVRAPGQGGGLRLLSGALRPVRDALMGAKTSLGAAFGIYNRLLEKHYYTLSFVQVCYHSGSL
jgi:hypothetical protein